jgi:hypothetical protein
MLITWSETAARHIRTRSYRYPGAADIAPEWTMEALEDPEMLWLEPDPKSDSGLGIRIIGYSISAGFVVTIIAFRQAGGLCGATAYRTSGSDLRAYREGVS